MNLKDRIKERERNRKSIISIYDPILDVDDSLKLDTSNYDSYLEGIDKNKLIKNDDYSEFYQLVNNNMKNETSEERIIWNDLSKNMLEPSIKNTVNNVVNNSGMSRDFTWPYSESGAIDFGFGIPSFNIYDLPANVKLLDFRPSFDWRCYRGSMHRQIFPGIPCRIEIVWCSRDFCWYTPYWRRWRLRWRRHCRAFRYPCGVRISTYGKVGLVNANFPRRRIYQFPGLSMNFDSDINTSGTVKATLSTSLDVDTLMDILNMYDPIIKAKIEGKEVIREKVESPDRLPKPDLEPQPEPEPQAAEEEEKEEEEILVESIDFSTVKNGPISTVEQWLNENYSKWSFNLNFDSPYYGHVTGQYLSSPTTDTGFVVWSYNAPVSDSEKNTGIISFVAYEKGEVEVVYGCTYSDESVKLIKNDIKIDETREVKKTFTFDVNKDDIIKIQEVGSVIAIYSLKLTQESSSSSEPEPEPQAIGYNLTNVNYNSSDVSFTIRNNAFGDYIKLENDETFDVRKDVKDIWENKKIFKYTLEKTYDYIVIRGHHGKFMTFMGNGVIKQTKSGNGVTPNMLIKIITEGNIIYLQSVVTNEYVAWRTDGSIYGEPVKDKTIERSRRRVNLTQFTTISGKPVPRFYWTRERVGRGRYGRYRRVRKRQVTLLDRLKGRIAFHYNDGYGAKYIMAHENGNYHSAGHIYGWEMHTVAGFSGLKQISDVGYQPDQLFKIINNDDSTYTLQHKQSGLYMSSSGGVNNKDDAEKLTLLHIGNGEFHIRNQQGKHLSFEGLTVVPREADTFAKYTIHEIATVDQGSSSSSIAKNIDLSTPGKIFDEIYFQGYSLKDFMLLVKWFYDNKNISIKFEITSWIVSLGFQLNSFGVYWGNRSLFGVQNVGFQENNVELLGGDRTIEVDLSKSGLDIVFNLGTYNLGDIESIANGVAEKDSKASLVRLIIKCVQNELDKTNLSSGRRNTMNGVMSVMKSIVDLSSFGGVPGLNMIFGGSEQEVSFAAQLSFSGTKVGAFMIASTYITTGSLRTELKNYIVNSVLGPIKFMTKYARINVGWLWRYMPGNVRNSINWLNRHINWANRVFLQYLTQGVTLALRAIDGIPLPNVSAEVAITAPVFGAGADVSVN